MSLGAAAIRSARDWSRALRLIVALSLGTIFTLLVFWLMMTNKAPWQINGFLAPGGIFAIVLMFIVRRNGVWYGLTLLGANALFYGALAHLVLRMILGRVSTTPSQ